MGIYAVFGKLRRYKQIVEVLTRHQLGFLVDMLGLSRFMIQRQKLLREQGVEMRNIWARAREVLEDLGGTFIKMGQILSTRGDILPRELIEELEKLQDCVPSFPFEEVRKSLEREMGARMEEMFVEFKTVPLASASLGQVHLAKLKDGQEAVIKVLRPDIRKSIQTDCEILLDAARFLENRKVFRGRFSLVPIALEIRDALEQETDYMHEVHNAERFRKNFDHDPTVYIPKVYWRYTTGKMLCLEKIDGVKILNLAGLESRGLKRSEIARKGIEAYMRQMLIHGFFHADPHPGNLFVTSDGRIAFVDFGLVGEVDKELRSHLADLFLAVTRRNIDGFIDTLFAMGSISPLTDRPRLKRDLGYVYEKYSTLSLKDVNLRELMKDIFDCVYRHQVRIPPELTLMVKTLISLEGLGRQLDPGFNIIEVAEPFAKELVRERMMSRLWFSEHLKALQNLLENLGNLISQTTKTYSTIEKGDLRILHEHRGLHLMVNRICIALVAASIFLGSSVLFASQSSYALIGLIGFLLSGIMGFWLIIAIIRSGRL